MKKKIALLLIAASIFTAIPFSVNAAISPAIDVLTEKVQAVKAGLYNCDVVFTKADFLQNLGLSKIGSVTFTSVPPSEEGYLYIANTVIENGMKVSEDMLDMLRFRAASGEIDSSSFSYTTNEKYGSNEHCFNIVFLDGINAAPVAATPDNAPSLETYKNVPLFSRLSGSDPEGDEVIFKIIQAPKKGSIEIISETYGDFKYTPKKNYTGKDTFSYVVCDKYGNYSTVEKVTVRTVKNKSKTVFSDVSDTRYEYPAIAVSAKGLMQGTKIGDLNYFDYNGKVTRAEMLSYIMEAADIKLTKSSTDKFADVNAVPDKFMAYVATAADLGIINGSYEGTKLVFRPNDIVTKAEAATMAKAVIKAESEAVQTFADSALCPDWCESAIKTAAAYGLIVIENGNISPSAQMTRGDAAILINTLSEMK